MIVLRAASLIALATSVALLGDYTSLSPAFCTAADAGCGAVRRSSLGYPLGIPMPAFGVAGFTTLFALSMFDTPFRRRFLPPMAALGAVAALALLVIQAVMVKTFCAFCVIVDVSGIVAGVAAWMWVKASAETPAPAKKRRSVPPEPADSLKPWAWWVLATIAVAAPVLWPRVKPIPPVPEPIRALYKPGKINVIEFADYQCPFCRMLHPELKKIVHEYGSQVHFMRLNLPLKSHPFSFDAAKVAVCAEASGKGEPVADALFATEDLSLPAIKKLAVGLGVPAAELERCLEDPETAARIHREEQLLRSTGFEGLPTTYIGAKRIVGAREPEVFREAFEAAKRGEGNEGIPPWLFVGILGLLLGGTVGFGRSRA
jgi:protein-disulfide isomerase